MPLDHPDDRDDSFFQTLFASHRWWWNPLMRHLEEGRYRLILALLGPILASGVALYFGKELVAWVLRPGLMVLARAGVEPYFFALGVASGFAVYIKVCLVAGVVVSSPWIAYQLWRLVSPRLAGAGRRVVAVIASLSAVMSVLSVVFFYKVLLPVGLVFLLFFSATMPAPDLTPPAQGSLLQRLTGLALRSSHLERGSGKSKGERRKSPSPSLGQGPAPTPLPILARDPESPPDHSYWFNADAGELHAAVGGRLLRFGPVGGGPVLRPHLDLDRYISFVTLMGLGIVIAFQLPVGMLILGWSKVVDPRQLKRYRKHCIFGCFVFGAVFTPTPDPFNMLVLTLPIWALFELGLVLMRLTYRRAKT